MVDGPAGCKERRLERLHVAGETCATDYIVVLNVWQQGSVGNGPAGPVGSVLHNWEMYKGVTCGSQGALACGAW